MKFNYTAKTQRGELQAGGIEAGSRESAVTVLQGYGLVVLTIEEEKSSPFVEKIGMAFQHVNIRELALFTRQFATLLEAQVPLVDSLRTLFVQMTNVPLKEAIFDVIADVESGSSLSQSFARHERVFSRFYIEMVRSAEITGRLQEVFIYMSDYLESQAKLSARIKSAMIYPAFIFGLFVTVTAVMIIVVIPRMAIIFEETGVKFSELPIMTRILFQLGDFAPRFGPAVLVMLIVAGIAVKEYTKTVEGRSVLDSILFRTPVLGDLFRKVYLARFAETTSVLISGDIPVAQALEISAEVVSNMRYRDALRQSAEAVRRGEFISAFLGRYPQDFPPIVTQMIAIGEKTGRIDDLLKRVSNFYANEIERITANLTELLQPIIIVVLGVFVGLLVGAIIMPIYQLANKF